MIGMGSQFTAQPAVGPDSLWKALTEIDTVAVVHVGLDGRIRDVNAGVARVLGYPAPELVGRSLEAILPPSVRERHAGFLRDYVYRRSTGQIDKSPIVRWTRHFPRDILTEDGLRLRFSALHRSGREVPVSLTVNEVCTREGELEGFVGMLVDCTEVHELHEQIRQQALRDEMTDLLNWRGLSEAVAGREREGSGKGVGRFSLLHLEIDHFSWLAFESRAVADHSIRTVAEWLERRVSELTRPDAALVARHFSASAFLVYLPGCAPQQAGRIADTLRREFSFLNLGSELDPFQTTLSIGTVSPASGTGLDYAVSRAANACHEARLRGHDRVVAGHDGELRLNELGRVIRQALRHDRIDVLAQRMVPLSAPRHGSICRPLGFEILSRLRDRRGEILSPALVFPAAERLGLAVDLDLHIVHRVMAVLAAHREILSELDRCSLNLSSVSLSSLRLFEGIRELIAEYGIPPSRLCFEITESSQVLDRDVALENVRALRSLGSRIALDDFGSGYSNYQSLAQWPVDIVKVDGAYVRQLLEGGPMAVDLKGIIASAKVRGLEVVAEFVETEQAAESLRELGVEYAQGFLFHCPEPLEQLLSRPGCICSERSR